MHRMEWCDFFQVPTGIWLHKLALGGYREGRQAYLVTKRRQCFALEKGKGGMEGGGGAASQSHVEQFNTNEVKWTFFFFFS